LRQTGVAIKADTFGVNTRQLPRISLQFQLGAQEADECVAVRLEEFTDRWVATVADGRRTEIGLGSKARIALTAAIHALAPRSASAMLADPQLFAISARILQAS